MRAIFPLIGLLILSGCAIRHPETVDIVIPIYHPENECVKEILMHGCQTHVSPPICKNIAVTYNPNCEQIQVKK